MPTWENRARKAGINIETARQAARRARNAAKRGVSLAKSGRNVARRAGLLSKPVLVYGGAGLLLLVASRALANSPGMKGLDRFGARLVWPLPRGTFRVGSGFGWRLSPVGAPLPEKHPGQDLGAPQGTPVLAVFAGRVIFAGERGGYGNSVVIDHGNGLVTTYNHLHTVEVGKGTQVPQGGRVGTVGSTGRSTGPHLHFEVASASDWKDADDPIKYLPPME